MDRRRRTGSTAGSRRGTRGRRGVAVATSFGLFAALTLWCSLVVSPSLALKVGGISNFSLGGTASVVHPGNASSSAAELVSNPAGAEGHVNIAVPRDLKLRQLNNLSTDYKLNSGSCSGGSPRFTANLTNGSRNTSIFFYFAPPPNFTQCAAPGAYANTGNLASSNSPVDASRLPGGSLNQPYSSVQASFGNYTVTAVHIDVDRGNQTVDFDNTRVNAKFVSYEPRHGISVLAQRAAGTIKVKQPGKRGFKNLKKVESIPVNSVVDTRGGRVEVTAATGNFGETTPDDSVVFFDGLIRLKQGRKHNARATAKLVGKLKCPSTSARQAKAGEGGEPIATTSRKRRRRVWGSGSGNYSTSGSGGTGSVRGTTWLTRDTCHGTFFKVTEGIGIRVHDFDLGRTVELGPGQSYFARNR